MNNGAKIRQPLLITGRGNVTLGKCELGFWPSPHFFTGYIHLEAREGSASIIIDDGVFLNNSATIIAERDRIYIGKGTLIGPEVVILDSDFHHLDPALRTSGTHSCRPVEIGSNVFIGMRCTVLKGAVIGNDSVVGAGSVVLGEFAPRVVIGGNPARIIKTL